MKVTCIRCGDVFTSFGAHIESFKDAKTQYICMACDDLASYTKRMEEGK
jgi:DNA-directed RNA polymerase subunit RPC12/RpoP